MNGRYLKMHLFSLMRDNWDADLELIYRMGGDDTEGKHRFLSLRGEQGLVYVKYEDGEERYYLSRLLLRCMEDILSDEDEDEPDEDGFDEDAYDEDETDGLREWGVSVWERFDAMSSVERGQEIFSTERGFRLKKGSETSHDTWTDVELTVRFGKEEHLHTYCWYEWCWAAPSEPHPLEILTEKVREQLGDGDARVVKLDIWSHTRERPVVIGCEWRVARRGEYVYVEAPLFERGYYLTWCTLRDELDELCR